MKIFYLFNHPAPYKIDFFNELGKQCDLTVVFSCDRERGRNDVFYSNAPLSFQCLLAHGKPISEHNAITSYPTKHLKKNTYDIVVINGYSTFAEMKAIRYLRRHKIPYIIEINGGIAAEKEPFFKKWLKTHYLKGASAYLSPDETSANYLVHYGADRSKIHLYPYSSIHKKEILPNPLTEPEKESIRSKYSLKEGKTLVSCGFFYPRKNFLRLIDVFAKMDRSYNLLIIGEGEQEQAMRDKATSLGLSNVTIMPFLKHEDLLSVLSSADAFAFLSKEDIYGHVIIEALSQGLPVVSSNRVNAAKRAIKEGENGYLVNLDDSDDALADAFEKAINLKTTKEALDSVHQFTVEKQADFHLFFFEEYLKGGRK